MKHVWSRFALSDRDDIFSHIEAESPRAAVHVDEQIADAAPRAGHSAHALGRGLSVDADTVRILRVLHGAQMWPDEFPAED